jgi:capsular polysaccharide biosynthesis protein
VTTHTPVHRSGGRYPDLARVVALARHWWLPLIAAVVAAGTLAAVVGSHRGATYESETRLLVGPLDGEPKVVRAAGSQAQTFSQLATSQLVLDRAQRRLGDRRPGAALLDDLRVDAAEATRVLTIEARAPDARTASDRANAVAAELMRMVDARRPPGNENQLRLVDPAQPADDPVGTGLSALVATAAVAGLLGALAVMLMVDYSRARIVTEEELAEVSGLPHLATVAAGGPGARGADEDAAAYSLLAGRVALVEPERRRLTLAVASAAGGPGGGHVAAELAAAFAADGRHVVLVDADAQLAEITRRFKLGGQEGLGTLLETQVRGRPTVRLSDLGSEPQPRLRVIPLGSASASTPLLLEPVARALRRLSRAGDVVIVSTGSSSSAAALRWAALADGAILVARRIDTGRAAATRAVAALEDVGATVIGTVLVERPERRPYRLRLLRARLRQLRAGAAAPARAEGAGGAPA